MPKLADLQLNEEAAPQVDWDAPEAGMSPPAVYPGIYTLLFKMPESSDDWFDMQEVAMIAGNPTSKRKFLIVRHQPGVVAWHANKDAEGQPVPNDEGTNAPKVLPPQRTSFYKNDKMLISQGGELLRALGVRLEGPMLAKGASGKPVIEEALEQLNGRVSFKAELGWRAYFKGTEVTVSTHPRKKKGDLPWPKGADGQYELLATNPQTNEKAYGYVDIVKIFAPTASQS